MNNIEFTDVFKNNYTEFAKYTINSRAIPSLEDGCKNIHRRIVWSMYYNKNTYDKKRVKCNTAVGLCMGYSPHGDASIYDAMVRFANDSVNINLIDGKGAFSSTTSRDVGAGASRYCECRLAPITQEFVKNINKGIAGMKLNYDDTKYEPVYLPVTFPHILANPNLGIAVGISSNICGFPLDELIDNTINLINNKDFKLMIPDFPTGGQIIYNEAVLKTIEEKGTGVLALRSKYTIEDNKIVITEIPYTTTREVIVESVIDLVKKGILKEVVDINDYTGNEGLNITIDLKRGSNTDKVIATLLKSTPIQSNFSCNFYVLDNGTPKLLGTKDILKKWIIFRQQCITNLILTNIKEQSEKLHLLAGLEKVLLDIDKAIDIIRHSETPKEDLISYFKLDDTQAENILNIKLRNINKDYITKQIKDINDLKDEIEFLKNNVNNIEYINGIIIEDLERVKTNYSTPRKTEIIYNDTIKEVSKEDLIDNFTATLVRTKQGYFKKTRRYSESQKIKDGDEIVSITQHPNKSRIGFITNKGNTYMLNLYDLAETQPSNLGDYIPNLIQLEKDEEVVSMVVVPLEETKESYLITVYENGKVSKIPVSSWATKTARTKLTNSINIENGAVIWSQQIDEDIDLTLEDVFGKTKDFNTNKCSIQKGKNSSGVYIWNSKKSGFKIKKVLTKDKE